MVASREFEDHWGCRLVVHLGWGPAQVQKQTWSANLSTFPKAEQGETGVVSEGLKRKNASEGPSSALVLLPPTQKNN